MEGNPLRIFGLLGDSDLAPNTAPLDLGGAEGRIVQPALPRPGHLVDGRFLVQASLGQGAFGEVMLARDQDLDRDVAIKFLFRRSADVLERFRREAQTTASLDHPNVLAIHEFRLDGERPYIVYELIEEARTLDQAFKDSTLQQRLDLFQQTLAGVAAAHARGVVHRDLKPENVLVRQDGQVRVADFGLARTDESLLTASGAFLGTPAYMAPEQVTGSKVSPASDVWSLGLILYEAIYGECWSARFVTPQELLASICAASVRRPSGGPKPIADLLFKRVLRQRPQDRLPDAGAFSAALEEARRQKAPGSNNPLIAAGTFLLGLGLGGLVVSLAGRGAQAEPSPTQGLPVPAKLSAASSPTPPADALPAPGTRGYFLRRRALRLAPQEEVRREAERGDSGAMRVLADRLAQGWRCPKDSVAARKWWERAAEAGCIDSLATLSTFHEQGGRQDRAREYRARALAAGSSLAFVLEFDSQGELSEEGWRAIERLVSLGDERSAGRAALFALRHGTVAEHRAWVSIGAALGSPLALVHQARFELHAAQPDFARLHGYLRAARELGHSEAFCLSALCLILGYGVEPNLAAAEELLEEAAALGASPGDLAYYRCRLSIRRQGGRVRAQMLEPFVNVCLRSGSSYTRGELGVNLLELTRKRKTQNRELRLVAGRLIREARSSVNAKVHRHLAMILQDGELPSPRRAEEAAEAFRRAAERSWREARGWGVCLLNGQGVEKEVDAGARWLQRAADAGDRDSWRLLGIAYADGPEVPELKDLPRALACFLKGARLGNAQAAQGAGVLLTRQGELVQARRWFELAASGGSMGGLVNYAACLLEGRGGPADPAEGLRLLKGVAPAARTPDLCRLLARAYAKGLGVPADRLEAQEWQDRAAALEERLRREEEAGAPR